MRLVVGLVSFLLALATAIGQTAWVHEEDFGAYQARVRDVLELPDGTFILATMASGGTINQPGQFWLTHLDASGALLQTERIGEPGSNVIISALQSRSDGSFRAFGTVKDPAGEEGYAYFDSNTGLEHLDSGVFVFPNLQDLILDNVIVLPDGGTWVLGSAWHTSPPWNRGVVLHLSSDGDLIDHRIFQPDMDLLVLRGGLRKPDGTFLVTCKKAPVEMEEPLAQTSVMHLNPEMGWIDGFPAPNVHGGLSLYSVDSVIADQLHLRLLPSGNLIMAGLLGDLLFGHQSVVLRTSDTGVLLDMVLFDSQYMYDQVGVLSSMCDAPDGDFYFAYFENMRTLAIYDPFQPSGVRVVRMDTALNVVCEWHLDGFLENEYYFLDRIVASADGGFILTGGKKTVGAIGGFKAWVQKVAPADCATSIRDVPRPLSHSIFPNPGLNEFTWIGKNIQIGTFDLHDALGRVVWKGSVQNGVVRASDLQLTPGMYHYTVKNDKGIYKASGSWVCQ